MMHQSRLWYPNQYWLLKLNERRSLQLRPMILQKKALLLFLIIYYTRNLMQGSGLQDKVFGFCFSRRSLTRGRIWRQQSAGRCLASCIGHLAIYLDIGKVLLRFFSIQTFYGKNYKGLHFICLVYLILLYTMLHVQVI